MKSLRRMTYLAIPLGLGIIFSGPTPSVGAELLSTRVKQEIIGGEPVTCSAVVVIGVVSGICGIVGFGWMVVKETYDGAGPGSSTIEPLPQLTTVREQTASDGSSCKKTGVPDKVQEYKPTY